MTFAEKSLEILNADIFKCLDDVMLVYKDLAEICKSKNISADNRITILDLSDDTLTAFNVLMKVANKLGYVAENEKDKVRPYKSLKEGK